MPRRKKEDNDAGSSAKKVKISQPSIPVQDLSEAQKPKRKSRRGSDRLEPIITRSRGLQMRQNSNIVALPPPAASKDIPKAKTECLYVDVSTQYSPPLQELDDDTILATDSTFLSPSSPLGYSTWMTSPNYSENESIVQASGDSYTFAWSEPLNHSTPLPAAVRKLFVDTIDISTELTDTFRFGAPADSSSDLDHTY